MARLLVLEDESDLREEIAAFMERRGHVVAQAESLAAFWPLLPEAEIAVIDRMLPDGDGLEAAERLRARNPRAGIVILTARGAMDDRLQGLYGGADHYLVKPFRLLELAAIVDTLLRRLGNGWRLDFQSRLLIDPEGFVHVLSAHETALFRLLAAHPGRIVARRALVEALGADWLTYDLRRLDTLVSRLRRRWREQRGQDLPLKTEYGEGYSFGAMISLV